MGCLQCGKSVPIMRRLKDKEFCSDEHRKNYGRNAARLVRESAALGEMEESWLVTSGDLAKKPAKAGFGVLPVLLIASALVVLLVFGGKDGGTESAPVKPLSYSPSVGDLSAKVMGSIKGGTLALRQEFSNPEMPDWLSAATGAAASNEMEGWIAKAGSIYPGRLRLWQPTTLVSDYQMNFAAAIENKAVGWAYRAADSKNYYATKLLVNGGDRSEIARWAVVDGGAMSRVQLPIPVMLAPGQEYRVQTRVQGNRFSTFVDDQLIDTWTDSKLARGGVGFFAEKGERAALKWVSFEQSEQSSGGGLFKFGFYLPVAPVTVVFQK